jgi:hypothetical protein
MSATNTAFSKPATCSPRSATIGKETLMLSSALTFQPHEQVGCFAWDGSLKPSTASPRKCMKFVRRDTWLLQRSDGMYFQDIQSKALRWTAQPEAAWSCLSPQRAAQVVDDFAALFGQLSDYQLAPVTLWCRADEYPQGWFCDE